MASAAATATPRTSSTAAAGDFMDRLRRALRVKTSPPRRGFTLIEALLVVAVLAILAGLIVPRIGGITRRQESVAIDRVADLLTMFAFRSSAGKQPVGLMYDGRTRTFELLILDIDPTQRGDPIVWQPDRLSMPAPLPDGLELAFAREDLATLPDTEWMIATKPGGERPRIELRLEGQAVAVDLLLEPYALAARRSDRQNVVVRERRDLDEEGLDRERW
jgi:prepilin-type N-terminal cleavage/methylation domain-containing protein